MAEARVPTPRLMAMGTRKSAWTLVSRIIGASPRNVVIAVRRMGRQRRAADSRVTFSMGMPSRMKRFRGDGEDEAAVHDHAAEGDHAEDAEDGKIRAEDDVADDGAGEAEGNGEQDDEGLEVAAQKGGHDGEDGEEGRDQAPAEAAEGVPFLALLALEGVAEAGEGFEDFREFVFFEGGEDFVAGGDACYYVSSNIEDAAAIDAFDFQGGGGGFDFRGFAEGDFAAAGRADEEVLEALEGFSFAFRRLDHDADFLAAAGLAEGFGAEVGIADGGTESCGGEAEGAALGGEFELEFGGFAARAFADIGGAGVGGDGFRDLVGSLAEVGEIGVGELDVDFGLAASGRPGNRRRWTPHRG